MLSGQLPTLKMVGANVRSSARGAAGTSIRQCPQRYRDLTSIQIGNSNGCFSKLVSAGLDPFQPFAVVANRCPWFEPESGSPLGVIPNTNEALDPRI